ncbi:MAG: efflux RND transporter permease subunit [Candidatus Xenobia bacterium]
MIERAVDYFLQEWKLVLFVAVALALGGVFALSNLDIEAYPDPAPPVLEIITQNPNWAAEEIERQITIPLETQLNGMPHLEHMRSISLFGLSDVRCYFSYDSNYDADRQEVINRIGMAALPAGVQAQLSPESTIGEIYRFQVFGDSHYTLRDLKEAADWTIERYFKQVPGVVDVATFGGPTKQFHVELDPAQLINYKVSVPQVMTALSNGNANAGGNYLEIGRQTYDVRGIGLFQNVEDIENCVVAEHNGIPIYVRQLGRVSIGRAVPLGRVGRDQVDDIVEGIVLMRVGGQTQPTLDGVHKMAEKLNTEILPPGMHIEPYYDREDLVHITTGTVKHTLFSGMILVAFILIAFLGDLRAALIVALTIPLSLAFVFIIMVLRHDAANLISMGAIDFGIIVDASVIMVENIHRHLQERDAGVGSLRLVTSLAAREVVTPIFFATIALFVSFLPLFTMQGVESKIFGPMALTYGLALLGALILAFTFSPVAASLFMKREGAHETFLVRWIRIPYTYVLRGCVRHPYATVLGTLMVLGITLAIAPQLGGEFMPKLEEGNLWVRATGPLSISYDDASTVARTVRNIMDACPEVTTVISEMGRPDDGTDYGGYYTTQCLVALKPRSEWPAGLTKEKLVAQLNDQLQKALPGVEFNFSQNIEDNTEEAMNGVAGENALKIYGTDLRKLEPLADQVFQILSGVKGIVDLGIYHEIGKPELRVTTDRQAAARYGLQVADVDGMVTAAIGGQAATQVLDGERRFDVVVRLLPQYRNNLNALRHIPITTPDGESIPLGAVAHLQTDMGVAYVYREDNSRYIPVKFGIRGRDLESTIDEASQKIKEQVKLPPGYYLSWGGEFASMQQAANRLKIVVPVTLLLILLLLRRTFNDTNDALLVLITVPLAAIGGIWALFLTHMPFSVSAGVGFISLVGVSTLEGVLLVSRIRLALQEGMDLVESILHAAEQRMRPVLMVACTAGLGLLPAATSNGIGSETQKPLATVVVVGMLTSALVVLVVMPALYHMVHKRRHAVKEA